MKMILKNGINRLINFLKNKNLNFQYENDFKKWNK